MRLSELLSSTNGSLPSFALAHTCLEVLHSLQGLPPPETYQYHGTAKKTRSTQTLSPANLN